MAWIPPPEPVKWDIKPVALGSTTYTTVTLRAPTPADIMKATALRGESGMAVALRLISAVSGEGIPFEALAQIPAWQIEQMSNYFESFTGAPLPDPLREAAAANMADIGSQPA
jgi:hypothetical protein